ncbi:uncharacterized protein LOC143605019 [Bidens hawaiensis]|uniref:uncharacterized protein LOC143605019 n=1 Tax=Bidens hawaiensis TaxID=980011 RepID=UPI00404AD485
MAVDKELSSSSDNKTETKTIDPNSPYYIHASDYPRQMQVNDALNDNNYNDWVQEMTNFFTAREIWCDLKERFGKESAPLAYELKQSLIDTRQDGLSVSAYYTKIRGFWDEIQSSLPTPSCTCGNCSCGLGKRISDFKDRERLYEFLMGLDAEFSAIRTHVLSMKPNLTLGEAYRLASEDEQQRNIATMKRPFNEPAAFQTFS